MLLIFLKNNKYMGESVHKRLFLITRQRITSALVDAELHLIHHFYLYISTQFVTMPWTLPTDKQC